MKLYSEQLSRDDLCFIFQMKVLQLTKFDYRLTNRLDEELQKLRCQANFHALRFTSSIENIGQKLVQKIRGMSSRYVAVHLRFEPDMLAFSGCYYGGGDKERAELGEIRKRWATLPDLSEEGERSRGKCPLTPHEIGVMVKALGFENETYLYVASGEIYGGEKTLQPLKNLFPNYYTKEMLADPGELEPLLSFSSRLAALDFIVSDESDVFVTNNNGNMAKILAGRSETHNFDETSPSGKHYLAELQRMTPYRPYRGLELQEKHFQEENFKQVVTPSMAPAVAILNFDAANSHSLRHYKLRKVSFELQESYKAISAISFDKIGKFSGFCPSFQLLIFMNYHKIVDYCAL